MLYRTGAGLILAAGFVWSTQGLGIRMIAEAESWAVMAWRSVGLIVALWVYLAFAARGQVWASITSVGRSGVLGALSLVLAFGGAIYAMQTTAIANAVVLFTAAPFFAAIIGWAALDERVPRATWAAIALAAVGIAVMVGGQLDFGGAAGSFAALISAFGFGAFSVTLRRSHGALHPKVGQFPIVFLAGVFSAVIGSLLAVMSGQTLAPPLADIGLSVAMGIVTLAGGMILYTYGSRAVPAAAATLLSQVEVILGPFWVWLFLNETISQNTAIGGGIVLSALALNVAAATQRQPALG